MVRFGRIQNPNPELKDLYEAKYLRYKKVLSVLNPAWKDLVWQR